MKNLNSLLDNFPLPYQILQGDTNLQIQAIQFDSRKVQTEDVFVAVRGTQTDGHSYISQAIERGAKVVICQTQPATFAEGVTYIQTENSAKFLGFLMSNFYDNPSHKLKVVGVTGTNGKTTNVTLLYRLFKALGYKVGLLSTVENRINDTVYPATLTTPDVHELHLRLAQMVQEKCTYCFMECSSHAIVQERIAGVRLTGAVFTNISHDHLDFHGTFDNYIKAKKKLFDELPHESFALTNIDDKRGRIMLQNCVAKLQKTFALRSFADFKAKIIENTLHGLCLEIDNQEVWFRLIGSFNAYNLLSVYATAILLGQKSHNVLQALSEIEPAQGRFEQIRSPKGTIGIIDYAHTPDALENVLKTLQDIKPPHAQIITVVGCGGNRDTTKRPIMAAIACQYSDRVILTSDNPRFESPEAILADMQKGVKFNQKHKTQTLVLRQEAIAEACKIAQPNDIILVAGKGHETYQEIEGIKYPFDDREVLRKAFESLHT
ncbi:MAG: UDP-N-acetylmuramoyl-L-alanyl-D-glutamate--2,6-diaminopimelate ligase [Microscillaceae bacterium]|nr:UDP-N-acetylmuramoyl-L-alanyl-D-glutamate--2,6-diaminopimelate ligase [Microscillaceae bacterium]MDW8460726.1 UDP-N-acetylmuramoyl-L-alanyl-D-glutamate--2,6-diaminopimelate ligase [Cytophagales bacterium]